MHTICIITNVADGSQYPLDSVKTRLQAYVYIHPPPPARDLTISSYQFKSFTDCVLHTYKTEGLHGFYRGALIYSFRVETLANIAR